MKVAAWMLFFLMKMSKIKWKNNWWIWIVSIIVFIGIFFFVCPRLLPNILSWSYSISDVSKGSDLMQNYGLVGDSYGIYNALFSALAFFGVICTLYLQQRDSKKATLINRFYKMLDYQNDLIEDMTVYPVIINKAKDKTNIRPVAGRMVFVQYKIQLKYLMKAIREVVKEMGLELSKSDIADVAYSVFFYGSSSTWKEFMMEYLRDYDDKEKLIDGIISKLGNGEYRRYALSRPSQNYLSVYFRNMYNTIKMIDSANLLSDEEKKNYIKMLRARLCNAELYVLFFNVLSRFGQKWIEHGYITKYELIQNLPSKYCDGYNPQEYFGTINYKSDAQTLSTFHEVTRQR